MTENNETPRTGLDRTFAPMLSELEDAEVALTKQHAAAVAEVRRLDAELGRLQKVKAIMLGEARPKRAARSEGKLRADSTEGKVRAAQNRERVMNHVATFDNGRRFTAGDIANALGMPAQGLGPILNGLERHGMVEVVGRNEDDRKVYRAVGAEAS